MFIVGRNGPYRKAKTDVDLFPFPSSLPFLPLMLLLDEIKISATVWSMVGALGLQKGVTGKRQIL